MHKYVRDERFNPKSFKSGSSVGYIELEKSFIWEGITIWSEMEDRKYTPN